MEIIDHPEVMKIGDLTVFLERIPKDLTFHSYDSETKTETVITGEQLREYLIEIVRKLSPKLAAKGVKAVELGSIQWFYLRGKTAGRFLPVNTMFIMRLLFRVPSLKSLR
jgi:hypothetical protein